MLNVNTFLDCNPCMHILSDIYDALISCKLILYVLQINILK